MLQIHRLPWLWAVGGVFRFLIFIALLVLIIVGIWALVRSARRHDVPNRPAETDSQPTSLSKSSAALDILQERYARGDIGKEEYEQIKRDLTS
jgi:putative membrane protein